MSAVEIPPHLPIRRKSAPPDNEMTHITERDLLVESRLTALETVVADIKTVVTQARPQIAIISMAGSLFGAVLVAVVVWIITGK